MDIAETVKENEKEQTLQVLGSVPANSLSSWLSSSIAFFSLTLRNSLFSIRSIILLLPMITAIITIVIVRFAFDRREYFGDVRVEYFTNFYLQAVFTSFMVPLIALTYGTGQLGNDREDRAHLFLLTKPIPRFCIYLARICAALPLTFIAIMGLLYLSCLIVGGDAITYFSTYAYCFSLAILAYICFFQALSVLFKHATVIGLLYALFVESFLGNLPGMIQKYSINYYTRNMILNFLREDGCRVTPPRLLIDMDPYLASSYLIYFSLAVTLIGIIVFHSKEYVDAD